MRRPYSRAIGGTLLLTALLLAALILHGVDARLASRGINTGFGFLGEPAGFQIASAPFPVTPDDSYALLLLAGLANTLFAIALALPLAVLGGAALAMLRRGSGLPAAMAGCIVEPLRNTPVLLQLFLWSGLLRVLLPSVAAAWSPLPGVFLSIRGLVLPSLPFLSLPHRVGFGFVGGWTLSPEMVALVGGLALFHAAYLSEIFRAGFRAVPSGQRDAALALGLRPGATLRLVILPQALRLVLPPLAIQCVGLVKNSTLAIAIGYPDLASVADTTITQTGQALEGIVLVLGAFLIINLALGAVVDTLDRRYNRYRLVGAETGGVEEPGAKRSWLAHILLGAVVFVLGWWALRWAVFDAVWSGGAEVCRRASGACWAVVVEKWPLVLFGTYPEALRWRPGLVIAMTVGMVVLSLCRPRRALPLLWFVAWAISLWLMAGGAGLAPVQAADWGGLPLTLWLATITILAAAPLAVPLTLARRSRFGALSAASRGFVAAARAMPLVTVLLASAFLLPVLLPSGWSVGKLPRVLAALVLVTCAYLAEALRGGLQLVPEGQMDAAVALGLSRWQALRLVVLPQALRASLPALANTCIGAFKDTSLVLIVGLFDLLGAARAAIADPAWRGDAPEMYLAVAVLYFVPCFTLTQLVRRAEHRAQPRARKRRIASISRSMSASSL
jgi:general L-amino acid transport system permease protein